VGAKSTTGTDPVGALSTTGSVPLVAFAHLNGVAAFINCCTGSADALTATYVEVVADS